jgi:hypothetical protein
MSKYSCLEDIFLAYRSLCYNMCVSFGVKLRLYFSSEMITGYLLDTVFLVNYSEYVIRSRKAQQLTALRAT